MKFFKNKLIHVIENKLIQYKQIQKLEDENIKLELLLTETKENEFIYNPEYPNYNTPFELIDFEKILSISTKHDLVIARTPYELYTLNMKSDEHFFEFIKKLIPVGTKTLIGKERLLMKSNHYDFNINLTETVDIDSVRRLMYRVHGEPRKTHMENIIINTPI